MRSNKKKRASWAVRMARLQAFVAQELKRLEINGVVGDEFERARERYEAEYGKSGRRAIR